MGKPSKKLFLVLVVLWFFISYLLMWFFGGACTNIFSGGKCLSSEPISGIRQVPLISLIIPYNNWVSVMYFFAPVAGFVLCYFLIQWFNSYFETKQASSIIFLAVLLVALFAGYYINLSWYYGNFVALNSNSSVRFVTYFCFNESTCNQEVNALNQEYSEQAQRNPGTQATQFFAVNYWSELRESIYLTFILGAIAAWLPFFLLDLYRKIGKE